ncbi:hypothetical protein HETIRDRAFT_118844 [Heterobasidion irregulare TC 32-1]|uniref:Uncharacterized protein n=1 Tax=Heterobasidion irregulare (strain TC 32-1) TaxID=747525 RepID=W4JT04_HETIT|nr:uncharacterized protein HETIRDRAFT_118844 [Heterobasidion irregulare TC 32-1]ETW76589.1 hypothetical protein HETIRDRAFT_118844 [Heterobasidion irregulare TC 32-1]
MDCINKGGESAEDSGHEGAEDSGHEGAKDYGDKGAKDGDKTLLYIVNEQAIFSFKYFRDVHYAFLMVGGFFTLLKYKRPVELTPYKGKDKERAILHSDQETPRSVL